MEHLEFYEICAFSDDRMNAIGNPAAICFVHNFPDEKTMGAAAVKLKRPMTSFIRPCEEGRAFEIRHFSPAEGEENHVCGHATVAAAEFLAIKYPHLRNGGEILFRLNPKFGINSGNACKVFIQGRDISIAMPAIMEMQRVDDSEFYTLLTDALGIRQDDIHTPSYYAPRIINYVVAFDDQDVLLRMKPDFRKLENLARSEKFQHEGIMATVKSRIPNFDVITRVFLPITGVDEDVACGSANCSVIPYWAQIRTNEFPPEKNEFRGLFPYPPRMHENVVGGTQHIVIDRIKEEITIRGQATFKQVLIPFPKPSPIGSILKPGF